MGKSYRKTCVFSITTCESEKDEKRLNNRKLRRAVRVQLDSVEQDLELADDLPIAEMHELTDLWRMAKDGKRYWKPSLAHPDYLYDIETWRKAMRK